MYALSAENRPKYGQELPAITDLFPTGTKEKLRNGRKEGNIMPVLLSHMANILKAEK